ncbi:peptidoglycan-binding protein, partial [Streptomyces adustus]|uniref:peptidoglycan-binding domain-containing protein n=1 Tax=Streptomyces adustus TaxID=1609272 RepID=UPI0035DDF32A
YLGGHGGGRWCPWCGEPRAADNTPSCLCARQPGEHVDERGTDGAAGPYQGGHGGGRWCPWCGEPRAADNTPSCLCARQPGDVPHDARATEAAAAEGFDPPTRIRPYVEPEDGLADLGRHSAHPQGSGPSELTGQAGQPAAAPDDSVRKPATVPPAGADVTTTLRRVKAARGLPTPLAPSPGAPDADDLSLFEGAQREPRAGASAFDVTYDTRYDTPGPRAGRRRRAVLLGAGAVVAVAAAAGLTGGLFSSDTPTQEAAASADVQVAAPDASADGAGADSADATADSAQPSTSASPSASSSPSESASASPSESESKSAPSASPSPSRPAEPTATATSAGTTASPAPGGGGQSAAPVLRLGDRGPEVAELQQRLEQLRLYNGRIDGRFTNRVDYALRTYQWARGVRGDAPGVYGAETRAMLEAETSQP